MRPAPRSRSLPGPRLVGRADANPHDPRRERRRRAPACRHRAGAQAPRPRRVGAHERLLRAVARADRSTADPDRHGSRLPPDPGTSGSLASPSCARRHRRGHSAPRDRDRSRAAGAGGQRSPASGGAPPGVRGACRARGSRPAPGDAAPAGDRIREQTRHGGAARVAALGQPLAVADQAVARGGGRPRLGPCVDPRRQRPVHRFRAASAAEHRARVVALAAPRHRVVSRVVCRGAARLAAPDAADRLSAVRRG